MSEKPGPVDNGPKTGQSPEERKHTTLSELQNDQPDLSPKQVHATSDPQQASKPDRTDLGRGTSRLHITEEYHEQMFNLRLLVEKHLEHQKELYHNFVDFRKAIDRV